MSKLRRSHFGLHHGQKNCHGYWWSRLMNGMISAAFARADGERSKAGCLFADGGTATSHYQRTDNGTYIEMRSHSVLVRSTPGYIVSTATR